MRTSENFFSFCFKTRRKRLESVSEENGRYGGKMRKEREKEGGEKVKDREVRKIGEQ
mgnify:CR=1 FL=1